MAKVLISTPFQIQMLGLIILSCPISNIPILIGHLACNHLYILCFLLAIITSSSSLVELAIVMFFHLCSICCHHCDIHHNIVYLFLILIRLNIIRIQSSLSLMVHCFVFNLKFRKVGIATNTKEEISEYVGRVFLGSLVMVASTTIRQQGGIQN
jgi:hypothetical protein